MAVWVLVLVSILNEYLGLLFSIFVVYFRPPGPLFTEVVVMVDPGETGLDLPISAFVTLARRILSTDSEVSGSLPRIITQKSIYYMQYFKTKETKPLSEAKHGPNRC